MKGPGPEATDNHRSLVNRLAAICTDGGVDFREREVIGQTPYDQPFVADLLLTNLPGHPALAVIARYQGMSGSAEQKLHFLVYSIRRNQVPCVLVLDGAGWSEGAIAWASRRVEGRFVALLTVDEFAAFVGV